MFFINLISKISVKYFFFFFISNLKKKKSLLLKKIVKKRLELLHISIIDFKSIASTNSATSKKNKLYK